LDNLWWAEERAEVAINGFRKAGILYAINRGGSRGVSEVSRNWSGQIKVL